MRSAGRLAFVHTKKVPCLCPQPGNSCYQAQLSIRRHVEELEVRVIAPFTMNLRLLFLLAIVLRGESNLLRSRLSPRVQFPDSDQQYSSGRERRQAKRSDKTVRIGVLAPEDPAFQYSVQKILPPITMAVRSERIQRLLPHWKIEVIYRDTKCSSTLGPLAAFEFYINKTAG